MRYYDTTKKKRLIRCYRKLMLLIGIFAVVTILLYLFCELFPNGLEELIDKIVTMPNIFFGLCN